MNNTEEKSRPPKGYVAMLVLAGLISVGGLVTRSILERYAIEAGGETGEKIMSLARMAEYGIWAGVALFVILVATKGWMSRR